MKPEELRELNQWIAERVMGWKRHEDEPYIPAAKVTTSALATWQDRHGQIMAFIKDYCPTTDPAASIDVLKRCEERGAIVIETSESGHMISLLQSSIQGYWKDFSTVGETIEIAVSLFARKIFTK